MIILFIELYNKFLDIYKRINIYYYKVIFAYLKINYPNIYILNKQIFDDLFNIKVKLMNLYYLDFIYDRYRDNM